MQPTSNIISLRDNMKKGRPEVVTDSQNTLSRNGTGNQRGEERQPCSEKLFIQITQTGDQNLVGTTLACETVDASPHGIKFVASQYIPVGSLVDLWVDDKSRPGKFFLSGDVRWTQKAGETATMIGVRLQEGLATDIENWKEVYA